MPVAAAVRFTLARGVKPSTPRAFFIARRGLGDSVRGPSLTNFPANVKLAQDFFTKGAISYAEYKAQCVSLRLFAFGATCAVLVLDLFIRPPKSSYWGTYGPMGWISYVKEGFSNTSAPLFLAKKQASYDVDVGAKVGSIVASELGMAPTAASPKPSVKAAPAPAPAAAAPAQESTAAADVTPQLTALSDRVEALEKRLNDSDITILEKYLDETDPVTVGTAKHAAFVFVKPHAVCENVKNLLKQKLKASGISVTCEGSIASETIDKEQLIDTHYGAIAAKAVKLKPDVLTVQPKAQEAFEQAFGTKWTDELTKGNVYNAMDAAQKLGISYDELNQKYDSLTKGVDLLKFGGGFYCGKVDDIYVINGFYMGMRKKFTTPGESIYYYSVEWDPKNLSWADFREKVLGGTDPKTAYSSSVRHLVYADWQQLGLASCPNTGDNAVHASASPFEALSERNNWLGVPLAEDKYGKAMVASGVPLSVMQEWTEDPPVGYKGKKQSIFDLLEDLDVADCLKKSVEIAKGA